MPDSSVSVPAEVLEALQTHDRILIAAHANPDGDAVGASAALGWALRMLGRETLLYNETGFPDYLGACPALSCGISPPCPASPD